MVVNMEKKYLFLLFLMIIMALLFFYEGSRLIADKIDRISKYDKAIKEKQEILNSAKVLNEQLEEVSKVVLNSITQKKKFKPEEINTFVNRLADLADKYKIAVHSLSPKPIKNDKKHLLEHNYSMEMLCTYVQLGRFLTDLESFDYIIHINTLEIKPSNKDLDKESIQSEVAAEETIYKLILELSTYKVVKEV